jgi:transcription termination/antitermination protein NusG
MDEPQDMIPQGEGTPASEGQSVPLSAAPPVEACASEPLVPASTPESAAPQPMEPEQPPVGPDAVLSASLEPAVLPQAETPREKKAKASAPKSEAVEARAAREEAEPEAPKESKSDKMNWYILKVQSNREDSIREGLQRRVKIAGLESFFGDVIVPTEMVTEFKGGRKRVVKRKLYPGYLVVQMEINEETWFLVRETPGIGDFTGAAGHPTPMLPHEVAKIVARHEEKSEEAPKLKINFNTGDRVKINEGTFENFEGEVESIDQTNGRVTVMINIFGRSTPVELEYWQIEAL